MKKKLTQKAKRQRAKQKLEKELNTAFLTGKEYGFNNGVEEGLYRAKIDNNNNNNNNQLALQKAEVALRLINAVGQTIQAATDTLRGDGVVGQLLRR